MAKRNTIQRQLVIAAVRFLADHPTAEEVYDRIKDIWSASFIELSNEICGRN